MLGALSRIKGADVLEQVATLAASHQVALEFHLMGFAYRNLRVEPKARLTVHGAYQDKDLPGLLKSLQPDLVWFPALWPETYSYTLSAALEAGLPVVAPSIGAFAERLQNRDWTWIGDWHQSADAWLAFFESIRQTSFVTGIGPAHIAPVPDRLRSDSAAMDYRHNYLNTLPKPTRLNPDQLQALQQAIVPSLPQNQAQSGLPVATLKSATLRALIRLRASPSLSAVARLVPMHTQRRVKTWLGR